MNQYFKLFLNNKPVSNNKLADVLEASWKSPSNIALVKYWGKKPGQLPGNPSLSMTLSKAVTYTWVKAVPYSHTERSRSVKGILSINDDSNHPFIPKLQKLYDQLSAEIPRLNGIDLVVKTENSFPHSTGIASSASGISAFSFCLLDILASLYGVDINQEDFYRAVSYASRLGSGSACRSVYGGFTIWGKTEAVNETSDLEAIPVNSIIHPELMDLQDAILVVSSEPKSLASSLGHKRMEVHPFARGRYQQAHENMQEIVNALHTGNLETIALIAENEALSLHALLMTSGEDGLLMKPGTLEIIQKIRKARKNGLPVFFTIDAGPNVHMLYPKTYSSIIEEFTRNELLAFCESNQVIFDHCGEGPVPIHTSLL